MARAGVALFDTSAVVPANPASWAGPGRITIEVEGISNVRRRRADGGSDTTGGGNGSIDRAEGKRVTVVRPAIRASFPAGRVALGLAFESPGEEIASAGLVLSAPLGDRNAAGIAIRYYQSSASGGNPYAGLASPGPAATGRSGAGGADAALYAVIVPAPVRHGWGASLGHYLRATESVRLGVVFDSGVRETGSEEGELERGLMETYPPRVTWGASYTATAKATFLWDFVWSEWRNVDEKAYRNAVDVRLGADYRLRTDISIRAGFLSGGERLGVDAARLPAELARSTSRRVLTAGITLRRGPSDFHLAVEDNHLLNREGGPAPGVERESFVSLSVTLHPKGRSGP